MRIILLSGGSGQRLWPLSNDSRSKQFLKMLDDGYGQLESMVQRVWGQLDRVGLSASTVIATGKTQVEILQNQLGLDVPLIVEPQRRDTFPAIALAAAYLYSARECDLDETVAVLPVDPYVEDRFFLHVQGLEKVLNASEAPLALVGVTPTFPSEKYGYIVPRREEGRNPHGYKEVSHFKEKPDMAEARALIDQSALWNCGVFAFKLGYIISLLRQKGWPVQYEALLESYPQLPRISFDYEVVEQMERIVVYPYDGGWKDLGTWNTLTEEMDTSIVGNGMVSRGSENVHIVNELELPVAVLGLSDIVVAVSPDGMLVSDKQASPQVKELPIDFKRRMMYEERRWGWYRILEYMKHPSGREVIVRRICIKAGRSLSYQYHHWRTENWTFVHGEGEAVVDGEKRGVKPGDVMVIPPETKHALKAYSDLEVIEIQTGDQLIVEDVVRIALTWEETLRHLS